MQQKIIILELKTKNNRIIFDDCKIYWDKEKDKRGSYTFAKVFSNKLEYLGLLTFDGETDRFLPGQGVVTRHI